ncbi:uncharacterized protein SCHCODRAFT_02681126 [Schizophyllum commune H4-8]|uniref:F-box domain-containing protein n=1 Tax=Schizophyllum commune (strain H4-8 / FGSC 9210) TaxID=578458 RepID=D8QHD8_SCHCM|nr:uncharacterized protein SCHCODRAFT_02681126 [Schizophyllum commune H4-8]KAI5887141.1 hypothetical protein SCHCODRAFT_02681126 [Schizophyllum commune H4-8]
MPFSDLPQELHNSICDVAEQDSLARLALTSKACYDSANPVLWSYVWTLNALLKLMPADAWNGMSVEDYGKLENLPADQIPLTADHWKPAYKLSSFVKELSLDRIPQTILRRVAGCPPPATLLPSLRKFFILLDDQQRLLLLRGQGDLLADYLKFLQAIIPSNLQQLILKNSLVLAGIMDHCTQITSLAIEDSGSLPDAFYAHARESLLQSLPRCQHLTMVNLLLPFSRHPVVMEVLSTLPALCIVRAGFSDFEGKPWYGRPPKYAQDAFPALRELELVNMTLEDATAIIETGDKRPLESISVATARSTGPEALYALATALRRYCDPKYLRQVMFTTCTYERNPALWPRDPTPFSFEHIEPLTAFPNVEVACLCTSSEIRITPAEWEHLAQSWPQLRRLDCLTYDFDMAGQPVLSLAALAFFAKFCPNIEEICVQLDASTIPPMPSSDSDGSENRCVRLAAAAPCEISRAEDVVEFLRSAFGNVTVNLLYFDKANEIGDEQLRRREEQWDLVRSLTSGKRPQPNEDMVWDEAAQASNVQGSSAQANLSLRLETEFVSDADDASASGSTRAAKSWGEPDIELEDERELHNLIYEDLEKSDLINVALASKACYDSTTPLIWENINGLDAILNLMPADAWEGTKVEDYVGLYQHPIIETPLTVDDWASVSKISPFVKNFSLGVIPVPIWGRVANYPPSTTILPSLRRLCFHGEQGRLSGFQQPWCDNLIAGQVECLRAFVPHDLQELELKDSLAFVSILNHCSQITSFTGSDRRSWDDKDRDVTYERAQLNLVQCLSRCELLTKVTLSLPFSNFSATMEGLATLPALDSLTMSIDSWSVEKLQGDPPKYHQHAFPALRKLELENLRYEDAVAILESGGGRALESITVVTFKPEAPTAWYALATALQQHCDPEHLLEVYLTQYAIEGQVLQGRRGETPPLLFDHIAPLTKLSRLRVARFGTSGDIHITDEQWERLAQAWPELRQFECLAYDLIPTTQPAVASLATLASIAKFCPDIEEICLQFDASSIPPFPSTPADPFNRPTIIAIAAPCGISRAEDVVEFLRRAFGNVTVNQAFAWVWVTWESLEEDGGSEQWNLVRSLTSGQRPLYWNIGGDAPAAT